MEQKGTNTNEKLRVFYTQDIVRDSAGLRACKNHVTTHTFGCPLGDRQGSTKTGSCASSGFTRFEKAN